MRIDSRTSKEILGYLQDCAHLFGPGPESALKSDAGLAMSRIFSEMAELVVNRLNKAPDNNLLAFLDVLGVKLLPPQPAVVPVVFSLSTGATGGVLIPAQTAVSAGEVQFQTDRTIWAIPQSIEAAFAYAPVNDQIFSCPQPLVNGKPVPEAETTLTSASTGGTFLFVASSDAFAKADQIIIGNDALVEYATVADIKDLSIVLARPLKLTHATDTVVRRWARFGALCGENIQEHCLYIGHAGLFNLTEPHAKIHLRLKPIFHGAGVYANKRFAWEYWGEDKNGMVAWHPLHISGCDADAIDLIKEDQGEIKKTKVNGIDSRWIRCIAQADNLPDTPMHIEIRNGTILPVTSGFDNAFYNDCPIDLSGAKPIMHPFGTRPVQGDAFYLSSKQVFSKPGTTVTLICNDERQSATDETTGIGKAYKTARSNLTLSWEYWNGNGWAALPNLSVHGFNMVDGFKVDELTNKKVATVTFRCPADISDISIGGKVNSWIRIRIAAGDFGREIMNVGDNVWASGTVNVPKISLAMSYYSANIPVPPEKCVTVNNLTYRDVSSQASTGKPITPFEKIDQNVPALYFGFGDKVENGPVSLYFTMSKDLPLSRSMDCPVSWYCYSSTSGWKPIDTIDGTGNLTRSGTVEFLFPPDFSPLLIFGSTRYWIKACYEGAIDLSFPLVDAVYVNAITATQAETVSNEIVGGSDTHPNQTFFLSRSPVIDCQLWVDEINSISEEEKDRLVSAGTEVVVVPGRFGISEQCWVAWTNVNDFLDSGTQNRHYVLDVTSGEIMFGNGDTGMIPPPGKGNIKATYRVGGGSRGNVPVASVNSLKTSIRFVDKVINPQQASGGADGEKVDSVKKRGPFLVSHRNRAVTMQDFERLAGQASADIKRTRCYTDNGLVHVIVVPDAAGERPMASLAVKEKIERSLAESCLNTVLSTRISIEAPIYTPIHSRITVVPTSMDLAVIAQSAVTDVLKKFLHPISGGADGNGWEFERGVRLSDLYAMLGKIDSVDHIAKLLLCAGDNPQIFRNSDIDIGKNAIACSGTHTVTVSMKG
jgi:Baseplate J-like protein